MTACKTCELVARRDRGEAPLWDSIHRTEAWDVVHCYETALPGWLVLVLRRHVAVLAELTEAEAAELGPLIRQTSLALQDATGCLKTYVVQFAEKAEHSHVHFHIIPRMPDQPQERLGTQVFGYLGVPEDERVSVETLNALARRVRKSLQAH